MRIGIDISQIVHEGTGVANYVRNLVSALIATDKINEYILFGASLRKRHVFKEYVQKFSKRSNVKLVTIPIPPTILDVIWNQWRVIPIELLTGPFDVFWSSDWTQPPLSHARGITTVHDVSFLRFPETFAQTIIDVQKRRLDRVKNCCDTIFCDSTSTKNDLVNLLGFSEEKLFIVYPGF